MADLVVEEQRRDRNRNAITIQDDLHMWKLDSTTKAYLNLIQRSKEP